MRIAPAVLLLILAAAAQAQERLSADLNVFPASGVGQVVSSDEPGKWLVFSGDFVQADAVVFRLEGGGTAVVVSGAPGDKFGVMFWPLGESSPSIQRVVLGGVAPNPGPPPGPIDPVDPAPPNPTVPTGERLLVLLHSPGLDGMDSGQSLKALDLQAASEEYPESQTQVWIKPTDQLDSDDKPDKVAAACLALPTKPGDKLPHVFVYSVAGGRAVSVGNLDDLTAEQLLAYVKGNK